VTDPRTVLLVHSSAELFGSDRQLELIATGLDPGRWRPRVALPYPGPLAGRLRAAGVEVHVQPMAVLRRSLFHPRGLGRLLRARRRDVERLAAIGGDLVHANTSVMLGARPVARRLGVPLTVHVREIYHGFGPLWPVWREELARADALVCVSAATRRSLVTPRAAPHVLSDGVVAPRLPARDEARARLGLDPGAFVVAQLGRITPWKGPQVLVEALARVGGVTAVLAGRAWHGEEELEAQLIAQARACGVEDRVVAAGYLDDVAPVLAAADVVAVPSVRPDPLPNAALEAAAAGRALVASDTGGLREIVRPERTGLLVPPGDPAALANALRRLRDDPYLVSSLGEAAAADVRARYAPGRLLGGLQDLWDDLLA
jgi:glycosyltransferase involved in cell wall biosynthesis